MKFLLAILLLLLSISKVEAQTYFANVARPDDSADCTQAQTLATAKKTIRAAVVCAGLAQGAAANKIVEVVGGTYSEHLMFRVANGGMASGTSWSAPFTLRARAGDTVTIRSAGTPGVSQNNLHISSSYALYADRFWFCF